MRTVPREIGTSGPALWERLAGRAGFWRRRFTGRPTRGQRVFDVCAGVLLPILCVVLDPIVFRGGPGGPILGGLQVFGYLAIALGVIGLGLWLAIGERLPAWLAAVVAGVLSAGALAAAALGVVLLPLSLLGLLMVIGVLGFSPFLTGFALARNAARAIALVRPRLASPALAVLVAAGAVVAVGGPWLAQREVSATVADAVADLASDDFAAASRALATLRWARVLADMDQVVWAWNDEMDPARKARLAEAYRQLTGEDIDARLAILLD